MINPGSEIDKCPICLNPILSNKNPSNEDFSNGDPSIGDSYTESTESNYLYDEDSMRCNSIIRLPCHHQVCTNCYHQLITRTSHPRCPLCNAEIPFDPYVYTVFIASSRLIGLRTDNFSIPPPPPPSIYPSTRHHSIEPNEIEVSNELTPYQRRMLSCSICFVSMIISGVLIYKIAGII